MKTQVCNHCGEEKSIEEFNWRWKLRRIRQPTCRDCQSKQKKKWYKKHGDKHRKQVYKNRDRYRREGREFILEYLETHPCVDCGESDPAVLEFDHVRGKKKHNISSMLKDAYSVSRIKEEIAKCVVRCANCHIRKTRKERGWWRA